MYDQQITYLSSNQRRTHTVRFLCCFAVNNKIVGVLIVCHFLSSLSWRDKWRVSWFNDFIGRLSSATKPRPQKLANFIDHLTLALSYVRMSLNFIVSPAAALCSQAELIGWLCSVVIITVRGSDDSVVFVRVFFCFCVYDNSWTAALKLMKFCMNMYFANNFAKVGEFQGQGHRTRFSDFSPLQVRANFEPLHLAWWNLA